ncbi:hypothetical protein T552_02808 [Pneumocystis carinii B80]|uniref:Uncharacterized protein n=1 Tax=Pneumocystis carinii (strain B80) TaxID=1408658 RepID=A0A0W4ZD33_PNEC8|nr:hypothetical protein T552_02808 [Pneumocystis carinii B80]KTW26322.1 hypothetical protein T552_02808 [Pneumocystis carinii B80]
MSNQRILETQHEDMIHDAVLDYYGRRLATCSSDKSIKIFDIEGDQQRLIETLKGHDGPVWNVSWAHPKFGVILASGGYDGRVIIWKEINNVWSKFEEHTFHHASVNSVSWAPHELGAILACGSSDRRVSILELKDDGTWDTRTFPAHSVGCNAVSWSPSTPPASLIRTGKDQDSNFFKRIVTGGSDNLVKIWNFSNEQNNWVVEDVLEGHTDWVRDVDWAPNIGLPKSYIASASQDKTVIIWTKEGDGPWKKTYLSEEPFSDTVWRVNWSPLGNILAVSCGDNHIYLYKETLKGTFKQINEITV